MRRLARLSAASATVSLLSVSLLVTACTQAPEREPAGPQGSPSASGSRAPGGASSETVTAQPTADPQGAIDQLTDWACEIRDGRWVATGIFENPSSEPVSVTLAVAVVRTGTREIVQESRHALTVPAGATQKIDLPDVGPGTSGTTCTRWIIG